MATGSAIGMETITATTIIAGGAVTATATGIGTAIGTAIGIRGAIVGGGTATGLVTASRGSTIGIGIDSRRRTVPSCLAGEIIDEKFDVGALRYSLALWRPHVVAGVCGAVS